MAWRDLVARIRGLDGSRSSAAKTPPAEIAAKDVLIVSGDRELADTIAGIVGEVGDVAHVVPDPDETRSVVRSSPPSMAVIDWRLPAQNIREIVSELRRDRYTRPQVMAVVTEEDGSTLDQVLSLGCDDYMILPISPEIARTKLKFLAGRVGTVAQIVDSNRSLRSDFDRFVIACGGQEDGIWDWDVDHNKVHYSNRWKEMLGFSEDEVGSTPEAWFDLAAMRALLQKPNQSVEALQQCLKQNSERLALNPSAADRAGWSCAA